MKLFKIFLVEDDPFFGETLKYHLNLNPDFEVFLFKTGKECLDNLFQNPNIICLDFGLPDITGDLLLKKNQQTNNSRDITSFTEGNMKTPNEQQNN